MMMHGIWNASCALEGRPLKDFKPVVRLYCPWSSASWLLSEIAPDDGDVASGLCDPGLGYPVLGSVRLSEMRDLRGPRGARVLRDRHFRARMSLLAYHALALRKGRIVL
jgi:Protein of unknown function (DUF2958)